MSGTGVVSQQKESNTFSVRSPVMNKERLRSGHWLESVICVDVSVLTVFLW